MAKYKAYPGYKDSGVEWLGRIPEQWTVSKVKYLAPFQVGWTPPTKNDENFIGNNLWVTISDLRDKFISASAKFISNKAAKEASMNITPKGSLLYSFKLSVGAVSFAGCNLYTNEAIASFLKNAHLPLPYLYYSLPIFIIENASTNIYGAKILNQELIKNSFLIAAECGESEKIAVFLDHETAKIDNLLEKQQQLIELLKEKRQALISHTVTKGLNPNVPMKDSGVEWLGNVPEHWLVCPIKHILSIPITDGPHETPDFFDEGIPFISAEAISTGKIDFDKKRAYISKKDHNRYCEKYAPKINDIYMVKSGATTGVTALVETDEVFNIWSPLAAFRCKDNYIPNYVLNFFRTAEYLNILALSWTFGTQQNIGMGILKNIHITCPPIDEAKEIAAHLHNHCLKLEEMLTLALKQVTLLKERRTALISAAVTGKIDLRDWTPPASSAEASLAAEEATA